MLHQSKALTFSKIFNYTGNDIISLFNISQNTIDKLDLHSEFNYFNLAKYNKLVILTRILLKIKYEETHISSKQVDKEINSILNQFKSDEVSISEAISLRNDDGFCINCSNKTSRVFWKGFYLHKDFCSQSCQVSMKNSKNFKEKEYSESQSERLSLLFANTNAKHKELFSEKSSRVMSEFWSTEEFRESHYLRLCDLNRRNAEFIKNYGESPTELIFRLSLKDNNISFTQFPKFQNKTGDFLIRNLWIELDGISHKISGEENELKRDRIIESGGFEVIHFTSSEIFNNIEDCINKIKLKLGV